MNYPYYTDLKNYTGDDMSRIENINAFNREGISIDIALDSDDNGILYFSRNPVYITYDYRFNYADDAIYKSELPEKMNVTVGIPTRSFIYLPQVEPEVTGLDETVHELSYQAATDDKTQKTTVTITYATHYVGHSEYYDITNEDFYNPYAPRITESDDKPVDPLPNVPEEPQSPDKPAVISNNRLSSSSGGGCNSGYGILSLCALIFVLSFRRKTVLALLLIVIACSCSFAGENIDPSDYTLPIELEAYTPSGTWTTDFAFTPELAEKIAEFANISPDKVYSYSEIALTEKWEAKTLDLYHLANNGEYGGVILPLSESGTGENYYTVLCTFSNDVNPGEKISLQGFAVNIETLETIYNTASPDSIATWVTLDENFNRVENVPNNRKIYLSVSYSPKYVNTGILTVLRGKYIVEEDPLERLDPDVAERIASALNISADQLRYLSRTHIGDPKEPTADMTEYVKSDNHNIIGNLFTVSVDEEGTYYTPYTFPDDVWAKIKGKRISDYRFYKLLDSESEGTENQVKDSALLGIAYGFLNAFELSGGRLEIFSAPTIILAGFLQASTPLCVYLGKLLLTLLMAGCNTGINPSFVPVIIGAIIFIKFMKKR